MHRYSFELRRAGGPGRIPAFGGDTVGVELRTDFADSGMRWITVRPAGQAGTSIVPRPPARCHDPFSQHKGETMMKYAGLVVFPASDLAKQKAIFTALVGTEPYADAEYYVGYRVADLEIGLDPNAHQNGPIVYWDTDDIAASLEQLTSAGASERGAPKDVGGGLLVATVTDASGNVIGLRQKA